MILGADATRAKRGQEATTPSRPRRPGTTLGAAEENDLVFADAAHVDDGAGRSIRGLASASGSRASRASSTGSSTSPPSSTRGGFDLQVGNPPWVRPRTDVEALLAEGDPWWQLAGKPTQAKRRAAAETLDAAGDARARRRWHGRRRRDGRVPGLADACSRICRAPARPVPLLHGADVAAPVAAGAIGLIHPETHFTDEKAGSCVRRPTVGCVDIGSSSTSSAVRDRSPCRPTACMSTGRARRAGLPAWRRRSTTPTPWCGRSRTTDRGRARVEGRRRATGTCGRTATASSASTRTRSRPGTTCSNTTASRLCRPDGLHGQPRERRVLETLSRQPRIGALGLSSRAGWHEKNDRTKGYFEVEWGAPESWRRRDPAGPAPPRRHPVLQVAEHDDAAQPGLVGGRPRDAGAGRDPGDLLQAARRPGNVRRATTRTGATDKRDPGARPLPRGVAARWPPTPASER